MNELDFEQDFEHSLCGCYYRIDTRATVLTDEINKFCKNYLYLRICLNMYLYDLYATGYTLLYSRTNVRTGDIMV